MCTKNKLAFAAALAMGLWYGLGVLALKFLPLAILQKMPQILLAKELAPIANPMEPLSLLIGFTQIFLMTYMFMLITGAIFRLLSFKRN